MNILGAEVHSKPSFSSEVLDTLAFGDSFIIDSATRIEDGYFIAEGLELKSQWYYSKQWGGYLFGSHFTTWEVSRQLNEYNQYELDFLGPEYYKKEERKVKVSAYGQEETYGLRKFYPNGRYTYISNDGCFDHLTEYYETSFNEMYHKVICDNYFLHEDGIWIPSFIKKEGNKYFFEGDGATQDLNIEEFKDGKFTMSSYDCT
ncbi:MAG: hypothetical protein SchgKO_21890 [Schleiferiaceae bacterium]